MIYCTFCLLILSQKSMPLLILYTTVCACMITIFYFCSAYKSIFNFLSPADPQRIPPCWRMLRLNPGLLRLWHSQSDALCTRLDLVNTWSRTCTFLTRLYLEAKKICPQMPRKSMFLAILIHVMIKLVKYFLL